MNYPGCTLYVLGAAHYRAGHYDRAVRACRRSLEEYPGWIGKVLNWPVLALAYHRLGNAEEARKALAQAWSMAGRTRRGRFDADSFLADSHLDYIVNGLELMVWLREAEAVILDDPAFPADPFSPLSGRDREVGGWWVIGRRERKRAVTRSETSAPGDTPSRDGRDEIGGAVDPHSRPSIEPRRGAS